MSRCAVISCNDKTKNNREVSYFRLPKEKKAFIKIGFMLQAVQLKICHPKSWYVQTIFKRSALILAGDFKVNCTIKTVKSVEGFSQDQYQFYYLIKRTISLVYLQRRKHWHKERKRQYIVLIKLLQALRLLLYWKKISVIGFFQGFCINFKNFET